MSERVISNEVIHALMRRCYDAGRAGDVYSDEWFDGPEIVRCRDCSNSSVAGMKTDPEALHCIVMDGIVAPDGFCAWGVRRDA